MQIEGSNLVPVIRSPEAARLWPKYLRHKYEEAIYWGPLQPAGLRRLTSGWDPVADEVAARSGVAPVLGVFFA